MCSGKYHLISGSQDLTNQIILRYAMILHFSSGREILIALSSLLLRAPVDRIITRMARVGLFAMLPLVPCCVWSLCTNAYGSHSFARLDDEYPGS